MSSPPIELVTREACPVCETPRERVLVELPYDEPPLSRYLERFYRGALDPQRLEGKHYRLASCPTCSLTYQVDVPSEAFLSELYEEILASDPADVRRERGFAARQSYAHQVEQLLVHVDLAPHEVQVLDFGAGHSPWLDMAAAWGCSTTAVELSQAKLAHASSVGHRVAQPTELEPESFQFINTEQVFEHLTDPLGTAQLLARALAPGGLLRISVPSARDIDARIAGNDWTAPKGAPGSLNPVAPLEHLNCYQHRTLKALAARVDLVPFHHSFRNQLGPMVRIRPLLGTALHRLRPPRGTMLLFAKRGPVAGDPAASASWASRWR